MQRPRRDRKLSLRVRREESSCVAHAAAGDHEVEVEVDGCVGGAVEVAGGGAGDGVVGGRTAAAGAGIGVVGVELAGGGGTGGAEVVVRGRRVWLGGWWGGWHFFFFLERLICGLVDRNWGNVDVLRFRD